MVKKNKCFILIIAVLCLCISNVNAQQQKQLTQNTFNTLSFNPGFAGHPDAINFIGTFRNQWTGFGRERDTTSFSGINTGINNGISNSENNNKATSISPRLFMISGDIYIRAIRGGIGLNIYSDQIGLLNNICVNLGYAYQHDFVDGGRLGIGAQVKFDNIVLDQSGLVWGDQGDPMVGQMGSDGNDFIVDCNFGIYYSKPNAFFGGISVINIIESQGRNTLFKEKRSFNVHGGYTFRFPASPKFKIIPSALIKTDISSFQVDLCAIMTMEDKFWFGVNYRLYDGLGLIAGLIWKDFKLGYSYDIPMSRLALGGNWGTHEIVFSYSFKFERERGKLTQKNTRYL